MSATDFEGLYTFRSETPNGELVRRGHRVGLTLESGAAVTGVVVAVFDNVAMVYVDEDPDGLGEDIGFTSESCSGLRLVTFEPQWREYVLHRTAAAVQRARQLATQEAGETFPRLADEQTRTAAQRAAVTHHLCGDRSGELGARDQRPPETHLECVPDHRPAS